MNTNTVCEGCKKKMAPTPSIICQSCIDKVREARMQGMLRNALLRVINGPHDMKEAN